MRLAPEAPPHRTRASYRSGPPSGDVMRCGGLWTEREASFDGRGTAPQRSLRNRHKRPGQTHPRYAGTLRHRVSTAPCSASTARKTAMKSTFPQVRTFPQGETGGAGGTRTQTSDASHLRRCRDGGHSHPFPSGCVPLDPTGTGTGAANAAPVPGSFSASSDSGDTLPSSVPNAHTRCQRSTGTSPRAILCAVTQRSATPPRWHPRVDNRRRSHGRATSAPPHTNRRVVQRGEDLGISARGAARDAASTTPSPLSQERTVVSWVGRRTRRHRPDAVRTVSGPLTPLTVRL